MSDAIDESVLDTLTPEEREALKEEMSDDELAALTAIAGEEEDGVEDETDSEEDQAASKSEGQTAHAQDDDRVDLEASGVTQESTRQPTVYQAELPEDYQAKLAELNAKRQDLEERFKEGEIDFDAFRSEDLSLAAESKILEKSAIKAEIAAEMREQQFVNEWRQNVIGFADDMRKSGGIDYRNDVVAQKKLDGFAQVIFSDPDNASMTMREVLDKAHEMVGLVYKPAANTEKSEQKTNAKDTQKERKQDLSKLPKTLAHVPGGDGPGDLSGEFANLDVLEGFDLEQAIARMSPAQREKFASLAN